jgi:hypothetical protein
VDEEGVERDDEEEEEEEEDDENEGEEEDGDEEGSLTRRNDDPNTRVTRRSDPVTSRGQTRATSLDNSPNETPRRRLRNRTVRNPSSTTRATSAPAAGKPKYYNSEFQRGDTQRHHLGPRTVMCPYCHAYIYGKMSFLREGRC